MQGETPRRKGYFYAYLFQVIKVGMNRCSRLFSKQPYYISVCVLTKLIAKPVFQTDRALSILMGRNVTAAVTFIIPEILGLSGRGRYF